MPGLISGKHQLILTYGNYWETIYWIFVNFGTKYSNGKPLAIQFLVK